MKQATAARSLRVLAERSTSREDFGLPARLDGWRVEFHVLSAADPGDGQPDLLLLALPPSAAGLRDWLARFRFLQPHCQVLLAEYDEDARWYRDAVQLAVDGLLTLPLDAGGWRRTLAQSAEALAAAEAQRGLLGDLQRSSQSLEESRRQLAGMLLQSYEHLGRVHRQLEQRLEQLGILYRLGRDLSRQRNWDPALDEFLKACVEGLGFKGVALLLWSFDASRLATRAHRSLEAPALERVLALLGALPGDDRCAGTVLGLAGGDLLRDDALRAALERIELLVLPLALGDEPEGFLVLRRDYSEAADLDADFHFLRAVQTLLSEALAGAKAVQRLARLSEFNRSVLDSVHAAVLTVDGAGRVSFRNPRAATLFGPRLQPGTAFAFDAGFHLLDDATATLEGADWIQRECRLQDETGAERRLLLSVTRLPARHDSETRHVMVGEDLTEYKRLESELRQAERLSSLGQLSAGMAHEIRNPLAGIAMTAQVLAGRLADRPETAPHLERIQAETQRLERIVRSLLEFSRPARPRLAALDLAESARRILGDLAESARAAQVHLEAAPEGPARCLALADADQIHQVLLNLLQNALQACAPGDRVGLRLERAAAAGGGAGRVRLVVWDSGPGVPEAHRAKLFDPFFTTKPEGTGLGLSVCRQILDEHGGALRHQPRPGGGAEFVLELAPAPATSSAEERAR
ncbi:MAG: ATP-binding protein [Candidatus Krumholzibacteriia bacterium]|nr:hypothetical protein [bacterium]MCB9515212.1 hypothetical protein [Candidatus Latescibacterota bacterium]